MSGTLYRLKSWRLLRWAWKEARRLPAAIVERRFLTGLGKWYLKLQYRHQPLPVDKLRSIRALGHGEDVLAPKPNAISVTRRVLHNCFLADRLSGMQLGTYSLSPSTLNFLEQQIQLQNPRTVLEFGSGPSTLCLARYMQENHGGSNRVYVCSIEQDHDFAQQTLQLLRSLHLEESVRVFHCPLRLQKIEGIQTICYDLSADSLRMVLKESCPDFILVDGPAAEPGARFGTLPLVRQFLKSGARFFMDDALRDGELEIAQRWKQLEYLRVDGVYLIGKGLLAGQVREGI